MAALQEDTPPKADSQYAGTLCDDNTKPCAMCVEGEYCTSGGVGGGGGGGDYYLIIICYC